MDNKLLKIKELENWFLTEYIIRLERVRRCKYLGVTADETEYEIQKEAYLKDQEYLELLGKSTNSADLKNKIIF